MDRAMLEAWLSSDDPLKRKHARNRLAIESGTYPSLTEQAGNALEAIGRVAVATVTGNAVAVPEDEKARRLAVCRGCDRFDAAAGRCTECGCWTAAKAALATEHCPLAKW